MSLKIKLEIDTIEDKEMEGYVSNDDGYKIRDLLCEAMIRYSGEANRKIIEQKFYDHV